MKTLLGIEIFYLLVMSLAYVAIGGVCPISTLTVRDVPKCPTTEAEMKEAAQRKKCEMIADTKNCDEAPVYHCLLNHWRNETLEVCSSPWFISGFCAIYDTIQMKVMDDFERDCTNFSVGRCPTRYHSPEAYKYEECYKKDNTSSPLSKDIFNSSEQVSNNSGTIIPVVILCIIVVILVIIIVVILLGKNKVDRCRKFFKRDNNSDGENIEATNDENESSRLITEGTTDDNAAESVEPSSESPPRQVTLNMEGTTDDNAAESVEPSSESPPRQVTLNMDNGSRDISPDVSKNENLVDTSPNKRPSQIKREKDKERRDISPDGSIHENLEDTSPIKLPSQIKREKDNGSRDISTDGSKNENFVDTSPNKLPSQIKREKENAHISNQTGNTYVPKAPATEFEENTQASKHGTSSNTDISKPPDTEHQDNAKQDPAELRKRILNSSKNQWQIPADLHQ